ncbi:MULTISPECIES: transglutaminase-like domain-containing protein [unclassified Leifsonia]|uniref:transglutaminase-like domain-containing protein n=1 Tax=unclassified Leifsonia TaxID=2663824 RepID=UPI0009E7B67F|nr:MULTISPECIES: transglutaminase-like domain-containing protein [unclassified Leifsonia]
MTSATDLEYYSAQSAFTDPGWADAALAEAPTSIAGIRALVSRLVFHYRASGDPTQLGFAPDRLHEIDLRYADAMLARLAELDPELVKPERAATDRILGCCRDYTVLFVALARRLGIPARARVGFSGYFVEGWYLDHVVAEVWVADEQRWRLVDAQFGDGDIAVPFSFDDVPRDRFLTGAAAWIACRSGELDPERFVVAPDLMVPDLRSWPYLLHNLVFDLAALNKQEMILWEIWGVLESLEAADAALAAELDGLAARLADPAVSVAELAALYDDDRFRVPAEVVNFSPLDGSKRRVRLRSGASAPASASASASAPAD